MALEELHSEIKRPKSAEFFEKAYVACKLGEEDEAIKYLNMSVAAYRPDEDAKYPDQVNETTLDKFAELKEVIINNKATKFIEKGEYVKALEILKEVSNSEPKLTFTYINVGLCYERLEKYDEALENYQKGLKLKPNESAALNNIGYVLFLTGKYKEALKYLNKALEISPQNIRIINNKTLVLEKLGKKYH